jgi:hypothetical protein
VLEKIGVPHLLLKYADDAPSNDAPSNDAVSIYN